MKPTAKEIHRAMAIIEKVHPAINTGRASVADLVMIIDYTMLNSAWDIVGEEDTLFLKQFHTSWKLAQAGL